MIERGFRGLSCPKCGALDELHAKLWEVGILYCTGCSDEVLVEDLRQQVATIVRVLAWLEKAPKIEE